MGETGEGSALPVARPTRAVIVVHGIGAQKPYDTLNDLAGGLRFAYPDSFIDWENISKYPFPPGAAPPNLPAVRVFLDQTRDPASAVDLFEGYWADLSQGRVPVGSTLTWLGKAMGRLRGKILYNLPFGRRGTGFPWGVLWAYCILVGAAVAGVAGLQRAFTFWLGGAGETPVDTGAVFYTVMFVLALVWLIQYLSDYVSDVQVYVAHRADAPGNVYVVKEEITDRVVAAIRAAQALGYDEISVVGHSLGTVVAYRAVNRVLESAPPGADSHIRFLITLAAPFNKIHALFGLEEDRRGLNSALVKSAAVRGMFDPPAAGFAAVAAPGTPGVQWFNVTAAMESVGEPINVPVLKFYPKECFVVNNWNPLTTHVAYFSNPALMRPLGRLLAGNAEGLDLPWKPFPYGTAEEFYWALLPVAAAFIATLPWTLNPWEWTPPRAVVILLLLGWVATGRIAGPFFLLLLTAFLARAAFLLRR